MGRQGRHGRVCPGYLTGMRASFRLGRVAGVPVGVNWSVLFIFALIAWGLAANQFPRSYPDRSPVAYAIAGLAAAVVFFVGLLAHEVSHAVVAKRNGLEVDGITLWLFGGVAELRGEPRDPGAELRIAGVGPLVSLLLGAFFGVVAALLALAGQGGLLLGSVAWLAGINVLLAIFNVLPAAPWTAAGCCAPRSGRQPATGPGHPWWPPAPAGCWVCC